MKNNELYTPLFENIYNDENQELIKELQEIVVAHKKNIVKTFYKDMTNNVKTTVFLTTDLVEKRLNTSMQKWLMNIFNYQHQSSYEQYISQQQVIGEVHARIKIPISYVIFGVSNLKQSFFEIFKQLKIEEKRKLSLLVLAYRIVDLSVLIFNDVYLKNYIRQEKNTQSLRHYYVSHTLAIEFEQARSALSHWHRELLTALYQPYTKYRHNQVTPIHSSKFGLWVDHRASLLFYDQSEIEDFQSNLSKIDNYLDTLIESSKSENWEQLADDMGHLNILITNIDWLLERIAKEIVTMEDNKDTLTRLFTRRYLPNIIQHEISYCLNNESNMGVVMLDIDHFKKINDSYGHAIGDNVLSILSNVLLLSVRPYDHVFRYGGEEFLIIVNNAGQEDCLNIAEKIRQKIAEHEFTDLPILKEPITVSLGIAMFNKHPDYEQLIVHADQALYKAKENGRNRVELYQSTE